MNLEGDKHLVTQAGKYRAIFNLHIEGTKLLLKAESRRLGRVLGLHHISEIRGINSISLMQ